MKKKLLVALLLIACVLMSIGGTVAYYTATETAQNVITTGSVRVKLVEKDEKGNDFKSPVLDVLPATSVSKVVSMENTGNNPCWVRMEVSKYFDMEQANADYMTMDLDTVNWTYSNGYYYYNTKLMPGESTTPLFTKVDFDPAIDEAYENCKAHVDVTCYAVQSANNGATALEAKGWPKNFR